MSFHHPFMLHESGSWEQAWVRSPPPQPEHNFTRNMSGGRGRGRGHWHQDRDPDRDQISWQAEQRIRRATLDAARRTEHHDTRPTVVRLIADLEAEKRRRQDVERTLKETERKLEDATNNLANHQTTLRTVMDEFAYLELREESRQRRSPAYMHHWQGGQRRQQRVNDGDTEAARMKKDLKIIRERIFEWANLLEGVESDLRTEYELSGKREIRLIGRSVRGLKGIMREALQFAWFDAWMSNKDHVY